MESKTGVVSKVKILKMSDRPLIFFKVDNCNCLIAGRSLSFFADVVDGMRIAVSGFFNKRNQLVVQKYCVIGKTQLMIDVETIQSKEKIFA